MTRDTVKADRIAKEASLRRRRREETVGVMLFCFPIVPLMLFPFPSSRHLSHHHHYHYSLRTPWLYIFVVPCRSLVNLVKTRATLSNMAEEGKDRQVFTDS